MSGHTQGKLETDGRSLYTVAEDGGAGTNVAYCGSAIGRDAECAANAERLVLTWNYCLGASNSFMELTGSLNDVAATANALKTENAKLLAALQEMVSAFGEVPDQAAAISAAERLIEECEKRRTG